MRVSPILLLHICSGVAALLSGAGAMVFRKGSRRHRLTGNIFVISMIGLGASGAYLGFMKDQIVNVLMGSLTCYLVATSWRTARRTEWERGVFDWIALAVPLTVGATFATYGFMAANSPKGLKNGAPATLYFILGSVALLFAVGDVRLLVRGSVSGTKRLARHLVRMCVALFIASGSLFLARPHLFPMILRKTGVIFALGILPLPLMIFWLIWVRVSKRYKRKPPTPAKADVYSYRPGLRAQFGKVADGKSAQG